MAFCLMVQSIAALHSRLPQRLPLAGLIRPAGNASPDKCPLDTGFSVYPRVFPTTGIPETPSSSPSRSETAGSTGLIELYLMRHGIAVEIGSAGVTTDSERHLSDLGESKLRRVALGIREIAPKFNLILTSPFRRCRQTAEIVAAALDLEHRLRVIDSLAPGRAFANGDGPYAEIFIELGACEFERALLVGHMPDLAEIASYLLTGNRNLNIDFRRGSICAIETAGLPPRGPGLLRWMMTPKQMRMVSSQARRS